MAKIGDTVANWIRTGITPSEQQINELSFVLNSLQQNNIPAINWPTLNELNYNDIVATPKNLTGDVTSVGVATTIAANAVTTTKIINDAVTYAKMQNVSATDKILGRSSAGAGDVEEIALTAAGRALIDDASASAQILTLGIPDSSGWVAVLDTWTYAGANSVTVPAGAASIYSVGDRIRFTQGAGYKYFYIFSVADTTLGLYAGYNYTVATPTAIANIYYSKALNPLSFPQFFDYIPGGISATNVSTAGRFMVAGRRCFVDAKAYFTGGITFTTMPALPIAASASFVSTEARTSVVGTGGYNDANVNFFSNGVYPCIVSSSTVVYIKSGANGTDMSATSPITWANGDYFDVHFSYEI
jgi:hypothetical protein